MAAALTTPAGVRRDDAKRRTEVRDVAFESRGCRPKCSVGGRTRRVPTGTELFDAEFKNAEALTETGLDCLDVGPNYDGRGGVDIEVKGLGADTAQVDVLGAGHTVDVLEYVTDAPFDIARRAAGDADGQLHPVSMG